jgi:hypothetical protein
MVAAFLGGFGNGSDTTFTNFERRDREMQVRVAEMKRREILYGHGEEQQLKVAAESLSSSSAPTSASASASSTSAPSTPSSTA